MCTIWHHRLVKTWANKSCFCFDSLVNDSAFYKAALPCKAALRFPRCKFSDPWIRWWGQGPQKSHENRIITTMSLIPYNLYVCLIPFSVAWLIRVYQVFWRIIKIILMSLARPKPLLREFAVHYIWELCREVIGYCKLHGMVTQPFPK